MSGLTDNIRTVKQAIAQAAEESGRKAEDILIVAASKMQPPEIINAAYNAGIGIFGENRADELREKYPLCNQGIEWHFIGQLQTNKVKYIAGKVSLIHSLDRKSLAEELDRAYSKRNERIGCLIEVNISGKDGRGGVLPDDVLPFAAQIGAAYPHICVKGIMAVMPEGDFSQRLYLQLKQLYDILIVSNIPGADIKYLSVGMSGDYGTAIKFGSNMVRPGSAIFGSRSGYAQQK